jgi:hypothetical protein
VKVDGERIHDVPGVSLAKLMLDGADFKRYQTISK